MKFGREQIANEGLPRLKRVDLARVVRLSLSAILLCTLFIYPVIFISKIQNSNLGILQTIKDLNLFHSKPKIERFQFFGVRNSFLLDKINLVRVSELSAEEFKSLILSSASENVRKRVSNYLDWTLEFAQKYQVDPFWVLAIMWTESHFRQNVQSYVNATGLMQIMPDTGHFVSIVMKKPVSKDAAKNLIKEPRVNIEMGVVYLSHLLKIFNGNYTLATVAYNLGPARVRTRITKKLEVGVRNHYLNKVRRYYSKITSNYVRYTKEIPEPYISTLAVAPSMIVLPKYPELSILDPVWKLFDQLNIAKWEKDLIALSPTVSQI